MPRRGWQRSCTGLQEGKADMDEFLKLPVDRRRNFTDQAQTRLGLQAASIEKDFWVCWTLRELFGLPGCGTHLTFKGGTSLSKGWGLIKRFSEDIDVVLDRDFLGFGGANGPEKAPSKKQQEKRLEDLKLACQQQIQQSLKPELESRFKEVLPQDMAWRLTDDPDDPDGQTLLFHYPALYSGLGYVRPVVKIELGARSDTEPCGMPTICSYLNETFPEVLGSGTFAVRTVLPVRTFWEKAMLLHEETFRKSGSGPKARLARHYYDLWCLIRAGVGGEASSNTELFDRVAAHRAVFFRKSKEAQETLRPGSLRLVPLPDQLPLWKEDYNKMTEAMIFGDVPKFDEILRVVGEFERAFNGKRN